jgi:hypothetical protein
MQFFAWGPTINKTVIDNYGKNQKLFEPNHHRLANRLNYRGIVPSIASYWSTVTDSVFIVVVYRLYLIRRSGKVKKFLIYNSEMPQGGIFIFS